MSTYIHELVVNPPPPHHHHRKISLGYIEITFFSARLFVFLYICIRFISVFLRNTGSFYFIQRLFMTLGFVIIFGTRSFG